MRSINEDNMNMKKDKKEYKRFKDKNNSIIDVITKIRNKKRSRNISYCV